MTQSYKQHAPNFVLNLMTSPLRDVTNWSMILSKSIQPCTKVEVKIKDRRFFDRRQFDRRRLTAIVK